MLSAIAGYRVLDRIAHPGRRSILLRAVGEADGARVVVKLPAGEHPTESQLDQIRLEHDILSRLDDPRIVRPVELARHRNAVALVTREVPGQTLANLLATRGPLPIERFLTLAVGLAEALAVVHASGVIHKDVTPTNVMVDGDHVWLIDFGIASVLAREDQGLQSAAALEATPAYMSPEQTGRMNRAVDPRSDLYSLGATLFHALVGEPPFRTTDPVELVHRHIATAPDPAHKRRPDVPEPVSAILGRLLAKMADDRYQSAAGLAVDLARCLDMLRNDGQIAPFVLGERDVSTRFQIPGALYGRQEEVSRLLSAFRSDGSGKPPLVLVTGPSGIGKSRLVREILRPLAGADGYFASGKFDQLARGTPFASPLSAFRGLLRLILAEQEDRVVAWRRQLTDALSPNAALVTELLPELQTLLGPQPAVPDLPPNETRNRFVQVFRQFVSVFARPEHPLVLFLDDLQWIDAATLAWLSDTLLDEQLGSLLIIGCYRDDEVDGAHPLSEALAAAEAQGAVLERIGLGPLTAAHVGELVADALHGEPDGVRDLATLVHARTAGNPFFVAQLLEQWARDGALAFDPASRRWVYDLQRARAATITDNVVDLMIGRIQEMSPGAQEVLQLAACVGSTFDVETLQVVTRQARDDVRARLLEAMQHDLVVQVSRATDDGPSRLRFQHDRVQQAAYAMLSDDQAAAARLTVGRRMLAASVDPAADEELFTILRHLDFARDRIDDPDERARLAELNLAAAARARRATAYAPAYAHVQVARELGSDDPGWAFRLACEHAECAHLTARADEAEAAYDEALRQAPDDLQQARVYESRIHFLTNHARFEEAYATAREGAARFGIDMPARFVPPLLVADLLKTVLALRGRSVADLEALPVMTDPRALAGTRLASVALKAAYQVRPELCVANASRLLRVCLAKGNFPESALTYLVMGPIFQGGVLGRHGVGFDWGRLALRLVDRFDHAPLKAEVRFVFAYFANSWRMPLRDSEHWFRQAWAAGIETGDLFHAGCASSGLAWNLLTQGVPLPEVIDACDERIRFLRRVGNVENLGTLLAIRQAARCLRGETVAPDAFDDDDFDEAAFVEGLASWGSGHFAHFYHVVKLQTLVLWGERQRAWQVAEISAGYLDRSVGMQHAAEHHLYAALAAADRLAYGDDGPRRAWRGTLKGSARKFAGWAAHNPANFAHKAELLAAEVARVAGRHDEAFRRYDAALEQAARSGFLHDQALIRDRAAAAYRGAGRLESARLYQREAVAAWHRWGAVGLAEARSTGLGGPGIAVGTGSATTSLVTTTGPGASLDMAALMRSAQAISGEVRLSDLLERLLGVLIENAGAARGVIVMAGRDEARVEAVGTADAVELPRVALSAYEDLPQAIVRYVLRTREPLLLEDAAADPRFAADPWVVAGRARSVLCTPLLDQGALKGVVYLENDLTTGAFTPARVELVTLLAGQIVISMDKATLYDRLEDEVRERTAQLERRNGFIRQVFGRYLSDEVVDSLLESPQGLVLGGEKRQVTILMSDLRGFTPLTETLPPEEVVALINNYLSEMTRVILKHRGTIDEFIGDAILVLFGAPFLRDDDAERAIACALEMQLAMERVNAYNRDHGLPQVEMGVGLATGEVVVGNLGSEKRAKYGVVGRSVNLAARIESLTVGGQVLVADSTVSRAVAEVEVAQTFPFSPKGVQHPVQVHEVTGLGAPYDLALPRHEEPLFALEDALEVRFSVIAGKASTDEWRTGRFVALSTHEAVLATGDPLEPLANLRIRLLDAETDDDLYAKVLRGEGDVTVRFTSIPARIKQRIADALPS